jgi:hypothetical protein
MTGSLSHLTRDDTILTGSDPHEGRAGGRPAGPRRRGSVPVTVGARLRRADAGARPTARAVPVRCPAADGELTSSYIARLAAGICLQPNEVLDQITGKQAVGSVTAGGFGTASPISTASRPPGWLSSAGTPNVHGSSR